MPICQRTPGLTSNAVTAPGGPPGPFTEKTNPPAYCTSVKSTLRTGPLSDRVVSLFQGVPSDARTTGAVRMGYGIRFGSAVGIGAVPPGTKPVNPLSSPDTRLLPVRTELLGSTSGPNVQAG